MVSTKSCHFVALLCSALFVTNVASQADNPIIQECLQELGIDPDSTDTPSDDLRDTVVACSYRKDGTVTPDGKLVAVKQVASFKEAMNKLIDKASAVMRNCEEEINSSKRTADEAAKMAVDCFKKLGE